MARLEQQFIPVKTIYKPINYTSSFFIWLETTPEQRPGHLMVQLGPVSLGTKVLGLFADADGATQPPVRYNFFHFALFRSATAAYYSKFCVEVPHGWPWMVPKLGRFPSTDRINSVEITVFFHSFKVTRLAPYKT